MSLALIAAATAATLAAQAPAVTKTQATANATSQQCAAVTPAQVEAQFERFNAAWATRNPDEVTALFAPDAVLLATVSNTPRVDQAGIRDYFVTFLRSAPVGTINSSTTTIGCNMATRVGTWTVRLTNPESGVPTDVRARYSFIYRYVDGQWRIQHLHSSAMPERFTREG